MTLGLHGPINSRSCRRWPSITVQRSDLHKVDVDPMLAQRHAHIADLARLIIVVQHQQRAFGLEVRREAVQFRNKHGVAAHIALDDLLTPRASTLLYAE